ncbi:hypothetical protein IE81DRAFT_241583 [Ceraceosorus guamensis]|uniref:Uncharacterized protein n=1 Tax=Ceraceosorus guamensis TaxID=1522189 RepID=A0A316W4N6_9BASI|nr:hypothetical protein IE81DRAFT_241583 [Ceraceosorus guamensis]PWN44876.1 hypothetical protein IE81DRAFT_241583 [Ceraceosorus guamensis]
MEQRTQDSPWTLPRRPSMVHISDQHYPAYSPTQPQRVLSTYPAKVPKPGALAPNGACVQYPSSSRSGEQASEALHTSWPGSPAMPRAALRAESRMQRARVFVNPLPPASSLHQNMCNIRITLTVYGDGTVPLAHVPLPLAHLPRQSWPDPSCYSLSPASHVSEGAYDSAPRTVNAHSTVTLKGPLPDKRLLFPPPMDGRGRAMDHGRCWSRRGLGYDFVTILPNGAPRFSSTRARSTTFPNTSNVPPPKASLPTTSSETENNGSVDMLDTPRRNIDTAVEAAQSETPLALRLAQSPADVAKTPSSAPAEDANLDPRINRFSRPKLLPRGPWLGQEYLTSRLSTELDAAGSDTSESDKDSSASCFPASEASTSDLEGDVHLDVRSGDSTGSDFSGYQAGAAVEKAKESDADSRQDPSDALRHHKRRSTASQLGQPSELSECKAAARGRSFSAPIPGTHPSADKRHPLNGTFLPAGTVAFFGVEGSRTPSMSRSSSASGSNAESFELSEPIWSSSAAWEHSNKRRWRVSLHSIASQYSFTNKKRATVDENSEPIFDRRGIDEMSESEMDTDPFLPRLPSDPRATLDPFAPENTIAAKLTRQHRLAEEAELERTVRIHKPAWVTSEPMRRKRSSSSSSNDTSQSSTSSNNAVVDHEPRWADPPSMGRDKVYLDSTTTLPRIVSAHYEPDATDPASNRESFRRWASALAEPEVLFQRYAGRS